MNIIAIVDVMRKSTQTTVFLIITNQIAYMSIYNALILYVKQVCLLYKLC